MNNLNEWIDKKARVSLETGKYYKGLILSVDDDFLKIRDFHGDIVFVRISQVTIIERWRE